ncbi:MAG TPA: hypothetical protein PLP21_10075 [Pyrinomonadaceae bacterium]|nr:hypothetical protein [Acidobacteriota bacterium]HQZ96656.1 hypothetical protein [Pyrinomonadaceae bacterium]
MIKTLSIRSFAILMALSISSCGWKPDVTAVPVTAPWDSMNLPIKENAVVWASTPTEFKAVHKDSKVAVVAKYSDALKAAGWKLSSYDDKNPTMYFIEVEKGGEKLSIDVYDFQGTGVIIKKK